MAHIAPDRKFKLEVSEFVPTERMVWEDGNDMFRGVRPFTLASVDGGTDYTMKWTEAYGGTLANVGGELICSVW